MRSMTRFIVIGNPRNILFAVPSAETHECRLSKIEKDKLYTHTKYEKPSPSSPKQRAE